MNELNKKNIQILEMINFKYILIFFFLFITSNSFSASQQIRSLSEENLSKELSFLNPFYKAIFKIQYPIAKDDIVEQTGFFVKPNLFLTALSPTVKNDVDCSKVQILSIDDFLLEKKFSCKEIVDQIPELGFLLIKTQSSHKHFVPVISNSENFSFRKEPAFHTLGSSGYGRFIYSDRCVALHQTCKDCDKVEIQQKAWMDARCLHYDAMVGAPVLTRSDGSSKFSGLFTLLTPPSSTDPRVAIEAKIVKLSSMQRASATLSSLNIPLPECSLSSNKTHVPSGEKVLLSLQTKGNVSEAYIEGIPQKELLRGYQLEVSPTQSTLYRGQVKSPGGEASCSVKVNVTLKKPPTCELTATPNEVVIPHSVTLQIKPKGYYTTYSIEGVSKDKLSSGNTYTLNPKKSGYFTARITGPGGTSLCRVFVKAKLPPAPTCQIQPSKSVIQLGERVRLKITPKGLYSSYSLENKSADELLNKSELIVKPNNTQLYHGVVKGLGGISSCSIRIEVQDKEKPSCELKANQNKVTVPGTTVLTIYPKGNYTSYSIEGVERDQLKSYKSLEIQPKKSAFYRAFIRGPKGVSTCTTFVEAVLPPAPLCEIQSSSSHIQYGEKVKLKIIPKGIFSHYVLDGIPMDQLKNKNQVQLAPLKTTIFRGEVNGLGGTSYCSLKVNVNPPLLPTCSLELSQSKVAVGTTMTVRIKIKGDYTKALLQEKTVRHKELLSFKIEKNTTFVGKVFESDKMSICYGKVSVE